MVVKRYIRSFLCWFLFYGFLRFFGYGVLRFFYGFFLRFFCTYVYFEKTVKNRKKNRKKTVTKTVKKAVKNVVKKVLKKLFILKNVLKKSLFFFSRFARKMYLKKDAYSKSDVRIAYIRNTVIPYMPYIRIFGTMGFRNIAL